MNSKDQMLKSIYPLKGQLSVDISRARKNREQLENEKRRYRVLFEHTGTATCIFGNDGLITLCNREFEKLSGYSKQEIEGRMNWREFIARWDLERMEQYNRRRQQMDPDVPHEYEFCFITRDRQIRNIFLKIGIVEEGGERVASLTDLTRLKHTEADLKESYDIFSAFMNQIPHVAFIKDADSRMIYINRYMQDIHDAKDWLDKNPHEIFPREKADKILSNDQKVFASGFEETYDRIVDRHGEEHHYQAYKFRIDRMGKDPVIGAIGLDVTARQKARLKSQESNRQLQTLIGNLPGMAYRCLNRSDWYMLFMSQGCERITGYPASHFTYNRKASYGDIIHPDDISRVWKGVQEAVHRGLPFEMEYRIFDAHGHTRWVWERGQSTGYDDQGSELLEGFIMDVTARTVAQEALRESEERYKNLFETTGTATIVYDDQKVIRMCNRKFEELYGLPRSRIINRMKWTCFVHDDDLERMMEYHRKRGEGSGSPPVEYEFKFVDAHGNVKTVHHVVKLLENTRQRIASFADVTRLKEAEDRLKHWNLELEEQVRKRTAQLEEANKELESFSYSVSHDLKAPLRAIEGFTRILLRDYDDHLEEQGKHYLRMTRQNASKMNRLISDLLTFSRLGRKALQRKDVDLNRLVYDVYNEQKLLLNKRRHYFKCRELPVIKADHSMMKIVFSNLLSNAFKFSRDDAPPEVEVGYYQQGGRPVFWVRDNGVGFDMKYAGRLFDAFHRLHSDERYSGSGIGLSMVQRVIHKHGGRIWAESEPNHQTTFYFYLGKFDNE